ncbi:RNA/RNP complex-1-interacting phosphatase isoform X2 [Anopheles gambiae]|uniref:RNA/RNP complex-1-interacting phosphatase isoform X2 n=1 Tax=Anopheles gambiae TaxID=7165 RepID=UPI002AC93776|nr:RNA/RNP complex-1-interacting phosphatase isoform X2 [Anopheles gambiae]
MKLSNRTLLVLFSARCLHLAKMRGKSGVPDRWYNYSCHGKVLIDRFIALKVPLSQRIHSVQYDRRFTPEHVIEKLPIGMLIDLTNTMRYYDPKQFTASGIEHVKLNVPGQVVPPVRIVDRFIEIVKSYLNDPESEGKLIGVHCTHGLNRTGYLICAYMILQLGYDPNEAIRLFNAKRGHRMERDKYLESLRQMAPAGQDNGRLGVQPEGGYTIRSGMHPEAYDSRPEMRSGGYNSRPGMQSDAGYNDRPGRSDERSWRQPEGASNGRSWRQPEGGNNDRSLRQPEGVYNDRSWRQPGGGNNDRSWRQPGGGSNDRFGRQPGGGSNDRFARQPEGASNDRSWRQPGGTSNDRSWRQPGGASNDRSWREPGGASNDRSWREPGGASNGRQEMRSEEDYNSRPVQQPEVRGGRTARLPPANDGIQRSNQERWDPSVRRIVRPQKHTYRVPAHRRTDGHELQSKHTKFE